VRFPALMMSVIGALALVAAPALAAGLDAHEDCDANEPDRNIAGCTRIIDDTAEGDTTRAVA
jgi:hypothetical protein